MSSLGFRTAFGDSWSCLCEPGFNGVLCENSLTTGSCYNTSRCLNGGTCMVRLVIEVSPHRGVLGVTPQCIHTTWASIRLKHIVSPLRIQRSPIFVISSKAQIVASGHQRSLMRGDMHTKTHTRTNTYAHPRTYARTRARERMHATFN